MFLGEANTIWPPFWLLESMKEGIEFAPTDDEHLPLFLTDGYTDYEFLRLICELLFELKFFDNCDIWKEETYCISPNIGVLPDLLTSFGIYSSRLL